MPPLAVYVAMTLPLLAGLVLLGRVLPAAAGRGRLVAVSRQRAGVLWVLAGAVALVAEIGGEVAGLWAWRDLGLTVLHAWWWWASLLSIGALGLAHLGAVRWFAVQLPVMLVFEFSQQATLGWVDHPDLLGSPYVAIVAIHAVVCALIVGALPSAVWALGLVQRAANAPPTG